jgi:hypothetical protein
LTKIVQTCILVGLALLTSGCVGAISNVSYNEKYKNKLSESLIVTKLGGTNVSYKHRKEAKNGMGDVCLKKAKELNNYLYKNNTIDDEFLSRNITITTLNDEFVSRKIARTTLNEKNTRILTIHPIKFHSEDIGSCFPDTLMILVELYDVEDLTKEWKGKITKQKLDKLLKSNQRVLIWKTTFKLNFHKDGKRLNEKDVLDNLSPLIITELDKTGLLPTKTKTLKEVENIKIKIKRLNNKKDRYKLLSAINCSSMTEKLNFGYNPKYNALCLGKLSFTDVSIVTGSEKKATYNTISKTKEFALKNSTCSAIAVSSVYGSKNNTDVNIELTYKNQLLNNYNNNCNIDNIDNINFLECQSKDGKDYFLEMSHNNKNRTYKKQLIQMNELCFNKFKQYYKKENLDNEWRIPYGYNTMGWDYYGYNISTKTKLDSNGYDSEGWNKNGINKYTKTEYDKEGYSQEGFNINGVNRNGFSKKENKFIKRIVSNKFPESVLKFETN